METWRRFLSEGSPDDPGQMQDPDEPVYGEPLDGDEDLEVDQPYYSPASEEPPGGYYNDDYPDGYDPDAERQPYYSPASNEPPGGFYSDDYPDGYDPDTYYSPASEEPPGGYYNDDYPDGYDPDAPRGMSPRDRDRQFRSDYDDAIESGMSHDEAMKYLDSDESYNF